MNKKLMKKKDKSHPALILDDIRTNLQPLLPGFDLMVCGSYGFRPLSNEEVLRFMETPAEVL